jgi:hypothetical protein
MKSGSLPPQLPRKSPFGQTNVQQQRLPANSESTTATQAQLLKAAALTPATESPT